MAEDNRIYWIWLAEALGQGSRLAIKLLNLYGSPSDIYRMTADDMIELSCKVTEESQDSSVRLTEHERVIVKKSLSDKNLDRAKQIIDECESLKIYILTPDMTEYPKSLCALKDMPLVLYCKGRLPDKKERLFISVVGTRKMSDYGRKLSYALGYGIALGGAVIVSGMALGSDSMAMAGAMDVGAPTVAVLGGGPDVIYPKEHREIYYKTISNGAAISEYPPGTPPIGSHFPLRNRIISGLSEGTVVVEGDTGSGSLITAEHALEQGKKVFAVPGKVGDPGSEGTFHLLYENALPCATAEDVLAEFSFLYPRTVNVDYVHAKIRNMDFESASLAAMERLRIGIRGESQYYGTGSYGGRTRDFKKSGTPKERQNDGAKTGAVPLNAPPARKKRVPDQQDAAAEPFSKTNRSAEQENTKKSGFQSIFGRLTHKDSEKTIRPNTKSKENHQNTTGFTLNMLDENDIKVYNIMQPNVPIVPDSLVSDTLEVSDIMCSLSTLELAGLVESAPGGYFIRVGENLPTVLIDDEEHP